MSKSLPQYTHDCDACVFLGPYRAQDRKYDLWVCPSEIGGPSLIARFSSEGPDYGSMLASMLPQFNRSSPNAALYSEIGKRAYELGIIK